MIHISQIKLPLDHTEEDLKKAAAGKLHLIPSQVSGINIIRRSLDARKKGQIQYIYNIDVEAANEEQVLKKNKSPQIMKSVHEEYTYTIAGEKKPKFRPVVTGSGPAGLFCAYFLALNGYEPLIIERGSPVDERLAAVQNFWDTGVLDQQTNIQFGEGGAGTFSDGKLNSMIKDPGRRIQKVLEIFADAGAPSDVLYLNKPHIGTDYLVSVIKTIRQQIIRLGGEFWFHTLLTDIHHENDRLKSITIKKEGRLQTIDCEILVLATGHSARDTFSMLYQRGVPMEAKAFAVGLRIEHEQEFINQAQYGMDASLLLPADYKLTHQCRNGRGVFTFCMCPGGYVVNASSEPGALTINGMSRYKRDGQNANSAVVAAVTPQDFFMETKDNTPLAGVEFQRKYEALAYQMYDGRIPVQLYGDLTRGEKSVTLGHVKPICKGAFQIGSLFGLLPSYIMESILEGIQAFDQKLAGFAKDEAVLSGVEMRTSSPVRVLRDTDGMSSIKGLYPCGEGAGYAGGITSSAVDGMKTFEAIIKTYKP